MATRVRNRPKMYWKPLSIEYVMYVYGLCLFYLILRLNLHLATIFYHLPLNNFFNFEPCLSYKPGFLRSPRLTTCCKYLQNLLYDKADKCDDDDEEDVHMELDCWKGTNNNLLSIILTFWHNSQATSWLPPFVGRSFKILLFELLFEFELFSSCVEAKEGQN